jgi:hypothetical protein
VAKKKRAEEPPSSEAPRWSVTLLCWVFLLIQIAVLPGAASAFRLPKEAIAVAGILAVVALGGTSRLRAGSMVIPRGPLALTLAALPLLQLISMAWAAGPRRAATSAAVTAVWVTGALWIAGLSPEDRQRLVGWTAAGTVISGAVLILQAIGFPLLVIGQDAGSRFRMTGLAGNPADFATAAVLLLPLLLVTLRFDSRATKRWLVVGLLMAAVAASQTFTGYLALGGLGLVWLIQQRSRTMWLGALGAGALVVVIALATGIGGRVQRQLQSVQRGDWYSLMSARSDGWTAALIMVRNRSVQGVGSGHFTHAYYPSRLEWLESRGSYGRRGELATHFEWAHCDPLQHIAELGAVGAVWLLVLLVALNRSRPRGDPLPWLAAAAATPFLLLHYPTHLAVGLVPLVMVLGHIIAQEPRWSISEPGLAARVFVPLVLVIVAVVGGMWQLRRLALDAWRASLEQGIQAAQAAPEQVQRIQLVSAVEFQVLERIQRLPAAAPWLWRTVGKARLIRADPRGAEEAFRIAYSLWPHEEAELGLGLALGDQGRRSEAMVLLGRVCRINPALAEYVTDGDLKASVDQLIRARRRAERQKLREQRSLVPGG